LEPVGEGRRHDIEPIGESRDPPDGHARLRERSGEFACVGVPGFPDGQLRADAQELGGQEATLGRRLVHVIQRNGPATRRCPQRVGALPGRCYHPEAHPAARACPEPKRRTILDDPNASSPSPLGGPPPGLRAQIGATFDAGKGLAYAHIELAKAEAAAIAGEVAHVAALVGLAIAAVIFAVLLVSIGLSLFLGEWLLGSMGWGILHGLLFAAALATACVSGALGTSMRPIGTAFAAGIAFAVLFGLLFGFAAFNRVYAAIGDQVATGIEPGVRPLVVGAVIFGVVGLVLGIVLALRVEGAGARLGAVIGLTVLGALIGAWSAITFGPQVSAGIGITIGYVTSIAIMAIGARRRAVDIEELTARFYPTQTIETSKETLEWLQRRMPPGIG
jgi:hypothetical protein